MSENRKIQATEFTRADASATGTSFALSPVKIAIIAVFVLLALAALFMFQARAVKFVSDPIEANVQITSGLPTYQLGERILMLSGEYDITAVAEGYEILTQTITVGDAPDQDIPVSLIKLPGIIHFEPTFNGEPVVGATVFVDQLNRGATPLTLNDIPAGAREILIEHPRYIAYQTELEVAGMQQQQTISAALNPAWADVAVASAPEGAEILIDDVVLGTTPGTVEVIAGIRGLKLKRPGYKIYEAELVVTAEEPQQLPEIVLIKSDGKLNIESEPAGVNITVGGDYYGQTPLSIALAPAENYEILATKAGYQNIRRNLAIAADQDQSLNIRLKPIVGTVKLSVAPAGAALFVNGKKLGDPNRTLELIAKNHELRVELPGYATFSTRVLPQPGLPQQLSIVLQTEEEAKVSATPQLIRTGIGNQMRFIIPGELTMGAGRREPGRRSNEIQKEVTLTRSYYLGVHEISNHDFQSFDPGHNSGVWGRALLSDPDRPAVNMSWAKAVEFCNWLSAKDGLPLAYESVNGQWQLVTPHNTGYRLPTEAEWAWASRYATGSKASIFPWGDRMPPAKGAGNFADESALSMTTYNIKNYNDSFRGPAPPGSFEPNELGIFDLAGNVSEWISDYYSVELSRKPLTDPVGPEKGDYRVIRGSNYTQGRFSALRWTYRDYGRDGRSDVGFRIARYAE